MRPVHQIIAGAAPGDAVTEQALRWRERLRAWGHPSEVVAEHVHPSLVREVSRLDAAGGRHLRTAAGIVLHYSIWSPAVEAALTAGPPVALVYHNVTPGRFMRETNPVVADLCDTGRARLGELRGRVASLVAVSAFNALDLEAAGLGPAKVVPLLIEPVEPPDRVAPPTGAPHLLTVGRIAPNKRLEDVLRVHALMRRAHGEGEVTLVGAEEGFERYRAALTAQAADLAAGGVRFTGRVSAADRDAAYAAASVYVCMSVHEGFCLPLIEAMQHGLPVVARAAGAVPETLAGAGLVLDDDDLAVFAEAAWEASRSSALRLELAGRARVRLRELDPDTVAERMREALTPVLDAAR